MSTWELSERSSAKSLCVPPWVQMRARAYAMPNRRSGLQDLIKAMLDPNPDSRPTARHVIQHCLRADVKGLGRQMCAMRVEE